MGVFVLVVFVIVGFVGVVWFVSGVGVDCVFLVMLGVLVIVCLCVFGFVIFIVMMVVFGWGV